LYVGLSEDNVGGLDELESSKKDQPQIYQCMPNSTDS